MAWVPTKNPNNPSSKGVWYRDTATGQTVSRRQRDKAVLAPSEYARLYKRATVDYREEKYGGLGQRERTKHRIYSASSYSQVERLLKTRRGRGKNVTAYVRVVWPDGSQTQTRSVVASSKRKSEYMSLLKSYADAMRAKYSSRMGDVDEDSEEDSDNLSYEVVFISPR